MSRDNVIAMFLGVAIGDALGMPVETMSAAKIAGMHGRVTKYLTPTGHKWYSDWKAGRWTDDTQLTLAVAESLTAKGEIDLDDIAKRSISAMEECSIGWGKSTKESLRRIQKGESILNAGNPQGVGNGVAMKVAPLAAFFLTQKINQCEKFYKELIKFTLMTHRTDLAVHSAFAQVHSVFWCLMNQFNVKQDRYWDFRESLLKAVVDATSGITRLLPQQKYPITAVNEKLYLQLAGIRGLLEPFQKFSKMDPAKLANFYDGAGCYVYNSLPFTLAMFLRNPLSIETLYDTVSAGGDTDTNGSMVGSLLGALNGTKIFPKKLVNGLWQKKRILKVANDFCDRFKID